MTGRREGKQKTSAMCNTKGGEIKKRLQSVQLIVEGKSVNEKKSHPFENQDLNDVWLHFIELLPPLPHCPYSVSSIFFPVIKAAVIMDLEMCKSL